MLATIGRNNAASTTKIIVRTAINFFTKAVSPTWRNRVEPLTEQITAEAFHRLLILMTTMTIEAMREKTHVGFLARGKRISKMLLFAHKQNDTRPFLPPWSIEDTGAA
jgi:hypothetical protein